MSSKETHCLNVGSLLSTSFILLRSDSSFSIVLRLTSNTSSPLCARTVCGLTSYVEDTGIGEEDGKGISMRGGGGEVSTIGGNEALGTKPGTFLEWRRFGKTSNLGQVTVMGGTYSSVSTFNLGEVFIFTELVSVFLLLLYLMQGRLRFLPTSFGLVP